MKPPNLRNIDDHSHEGKFHRYRRWRQACIGLLIATLAFIFPHPLRAQPHYEFLRKIENPQGAEDGSGDQFGGSLAQVGDNFVVGAYRDDIGAVDSGSAYVFDQEGSLIASIPNPSPNEDDWFGFDVAGVAGNVVVGAERDDTDGMETGSVYVFTQAGELVRRISNPFPDEFDIFGTKVASVGDRLVVSAWGDDANGTNAGAAYLFDLDGNLLQEFYSPKANEFRFGRNIESVGDDRLLISSLQVDDDSITGGSAYLFDLEGNVLQEFVNPDPMRDDLFGVGLAGVGGEQIVVGAYEHTSDDISGGIAYVFDLEGNFQHAIENPNPANRDWFGYRVTPVKGGNTLISSPNDDTADNNAGAAYLYDSSGELLQTLLSPNPTNTGHFSNSPATLNELILIGAHLDIGGGFGPGAVYIYAPILNLKGDYNDDGRVDQTDMDLVLLSWGAGAAVPPIGWTSNLPEGLVDQDELDQVLLNWGQSQSDVSSSAVPEPTTLALIFALLLLCLRLSILHR